jgi:hypothetical protein
VITGNRLDSFTRYEQKSEVSFVPEQLIGVSIGKIPASYLGAVHHHQYESEQPKEEAVENGLEIPGVAEHY